MQELPLGTATVKVDPANVPTLVNVSLVVVAVPPGSALVAPNRLIVVQLLLLVTIAVGLAVERQVVVLCPSCRTKLPEAKLFPVLVIVAVKPPIAVTAAPSRSTLLKAPVKRSADERRATRRRENKVFTKRMYNTSLFLTTKNV